MAYMTCLDSTSGSIITTPLSGRASICGPVSWLPSSVGRPRPRRCYVAWVALCRYKVIRWSEFHDDFTVTTSPAAMLATSGRTLFIWILSLFDDLFQVCSREASYSELEIRGHLGRQSPEWRRECRQYGQHCRTKRLLGQMCGS